MTEQEFVARMDADSRAAKAFISHPLSRMIERASVEGVKSIRMKNRTEWFKYLSLWLVAFRGCPRSDDGSVLYFGVKVYG